MTCIADTSSINLTVASGQLSADLVVDPASGISPNRLVVNPAGVYVASDGWVPIPATLAFSSTDSHVFVATTSVDLRGYLGPGDRIRLIQSGVPAYFVVVAIAVGTITLYGGTLYTLAASAITLPFFSKAKSPAGFPLEPSKWQEQTSNTSGNSQGSPSIGVWYNPGGIFLPVPIGCWDLYYMAFCSGLAASGAEAILTATLSTANNSESDGDFSAKLRSLVGATPLIASELSRRKMITLAAKTNYFLNIQTTISTMSSLVLQGGASSPLIIRAVCAYL